MTETKNDNSKERAEERHTQVATVGLVVLPLLQLLVCAPHRWYSVPF
jgi:hypothetical protein